jgi:cysteine desulfurase
MSTKSKSKNIPNTIYLDNNGTTQACKECIGVMAEWMKYPANPSSDSDFANAAKKLITNSKLQIQKICNAQDYEVIFTSGGSESNCLIIKSIVSGWKRMISEIPHIISTEMEHKSVLKCLRNLEQSKEIELTLIEPESYGIIHPKHVTDAIKPNTALISIMYSNNEIGSINPMIKIGSIAKERNIPVHSDCVQIFGKRPPDLKLSNISAVSVSFHKLFGPQGVGLAIISKELISGYNIIGEIAGSQQGGLRGGTENVAGIAGSMAALRNTLTNRSSKNTKLLEMRNRMLDCFENNFEIYNYNDYFALEDDNENSILNTQEYKNRQGIVVLGPSRERISKYMPNTILFSVIDHKSDFCNVKFKKMLHNMGIIVSIGSACNTGEVTGSHVLESIYAPKILVRGTIRISLGDMNTMTEINTVCKKLVMLIKKIFAEGFPQNIKF